MSPNEDYPAWCGDCGKIQILISSPPNPMESEATAKASKKPDTSQEEEKCKCNNGFDCDRIPCLCKCHKSPKPDTTQGETKNDSSSYDFEGRDYPKPDSRREEVDIDELIYELDNGSKERLRKLYAIRDYVFTLQDENALLVSKLKEAEEALMAHKKWSEAEDNPKGTNFSERCGLCSEAIHLTEQALDFIRSSPSSK